MSEFGLQALPDAATVAEMFPAGAPAVTGRSALGRSARPRSKSCATTPARMPALRRAQGATLPRHRGHAARPGDGVAGGDRGMPAAARDAVRARCVAGRPSSDRRGAESVFTDAFCVLSVLRGELPRCGGVAFWQFNEPWPAVSWSVIDRAGRPKAAYEMLRRAYQPILIAARFPWRRYAPGDVFRAEIWLVNDGPAAWQGCSAEALLDGAVVWSVNDLTLPPASATRIGELVVPLDVAPQALTLDLRCGEMLLASNRYDLAVHLPGRQPRSRRAIHAVGERLLEMD